MSERCIGCLHWFETWTKPTADYTAANSDRWGTCQQIRDRIDVEIVVPPYSSGANLGAVETRGDFGCPMRVPAAGAGEEKGNG